MVLVLEASEAGPLSATNTLTSPVCLAAHGPVDRQADLQRHPEALQPVSRQRQPEDQRQTVLRQGGGSLPQRLM